MHDDGENWEILTDPSAYEAVLEAVKKAGITRIGQRRYDSAELHQARRTAANTMIRLMEALEDHDDVQNVHSNFDIDQKRWKKSQDSF